MDVIFSDQFRSGTDLIATHLVVVVLAAITSKGIRLCRFKSDREEIWQGCSSCKQCWVSYSQKVTSYWY